MIYILGGANRSGKTLLSRRAVAEKGIPYFPLDALFGALASGVLELGVTWKQSPTERAEKMWPITKPALGFFFHEERDFLIEGDTILPKHVRELQEDGHQVKSCFLGYTDLDREEKLAHIRTYHQGSRDWTKGIPDEDMVTYIDVSISFSKYLKEECAKYDIRYFDISHDFGSPREELFDYLFA